MPLSRGLGRVESSELHNRSNRIDHWQRFKTGDFGQKWNSSKLIVREGKGAIAPLLELLNDPAVDCETHWFTIRALGHFPEPDVIGAIARQIDDPADYVNRTAEQATELSSFAIETLAAMGAAAIDILSQLLTHPERRLLAAKALNQVRSSGVIPAMVSVADDENAEVRYYAIDALGSFHSDLVTPILLRALSDPSAAVRKSAVMSLGRRQDLQISHQLSHQLQPLLWDVNLSVSCQTALALGRLGDGDNLDALQRVLVSAHTPMALRIDTVRALEWYCDRSDLTTQTTQRAFAVLNSALRDFSAAETNKDKPLNPQENSQILLAIVRVLGELRQGAIAQQATQSLIGYLKRQPATIIVQAIIMALASLGQSQAFDALLPLLSHPTDAVPIHAISALKRLDPEHSFERASAYLEDHDSQAKVLQFW